MNFRPALLALIFAAVAAATPFTLPAPCVSGTLASYIALGGTGCSIDILRFNDFGFGVLAAGGGATPISAGHIQVQPVLTGSRASLVFSSAGFSVAGSKFASYLVAYTVDPHPEIVDFTLDLTTFTPVAPGSVVITADLCIGAAFVGAVCPATPSTSSVFHNGTTADLFDRVVFAPVATVGVRTTIGLQANGASADFDGFTTGQAIIPEPQSLWLSAPACIGLLAIVRRWKSAGRRARQLR